MAQRPADLSFSDEEERRHFTILAGGVVMKQFADKSLGDVQS